MDYSFDKAQLANVGVLLGPGFINWAWQRLPSQGDTLRLALPNPHPDGRSLSTNDIYDLGLYGTLS